MKELVDFVILIIIYFLKFYKKWKEKGRDVLFVNTLMYIYLSFVLYFTLMPIITSLPFIFNHPYDSINLVPFIDVLNGRGDFVRQVGLNVVMTISFGFLMPLVKKENGIYTWTDTIRYPFQKIHDELGIEKCRFYDLRGSYATQIFD